MIPDYKANAVYMSVWIEKDYNEVYVALTKIFKKHHVAYGIIPATKDVWCRDYMPFATGCGQISLLCIPAGLFTEEVL